MVTIEERIEQFAAMTPEERRAYETRFSAELLRQIVDEEVEDWQAEVLRPMVDLALMPPTVHAEPGSAYAYEQLDYAMNLGIERTPGGRLWAAWVAGADGPEAFIVVATSEDHGETWSPGPSLVIDSHSPALPYPRTNWGGNLWTDPGGRLWFFFTQVMNARDGRHGVWAIHSDNPEDDLPVWSEPRRLWHGGALNKPLVLSTGEWVLPLYLLQSDFGMGRGRPPFRDLFPELEPDRGAHAFVSSDKGRTWASRGQVRFPNPQFPEHMFVERKDGALWMLARTRTGIMQSLSEDGGRTWSAPAALEGVEHPVSRFHIRRMASGSLLLIKHGETIDSFRGDWGRSHLTAWLSEDDGRSWRGGLMLDERSGISYPDGLEAPDGTLYVTYDRRRGGHEGDPGEILMARFTEADVLAGELVSPGSRLKMLVHRANPDSWDGR